MAVSGVGRMGPATDGWALPSSAGFPHRVCASDRNDLVRSYVVHRDVTSRTAYSIRVHPCHPGRVGEESTALVRALVDEATKKSGVVWLSAGRSGAPTSSGPAARPAWHLWHEGSAYVVVGGQEQSVPGLAAAATINGKATVTVRSKDNGGRLVGWQADVSVVDPAGELWDTVAPLLHAKRLNASDGEAQMSRWAAESTIIRLSPDGQYAEQPGKLSAGPHALPPAVTGATTRVPVPFTLAGWRRRRAARG